MVLNLDDITAQLRQQIASGRNINEIAEWLNARGIKFSARRSVRPAEQISLRHLPRVQAMKPDEIESFELEGGRLQVMRVVDFSLAPVSESDAAPRIAQFLLNRRSSEVITEEMERLRQTATIEYVGEFADGERASESGPDVPPPQ